MLQRFLFIMTIAVAATASMIAPHFAQQAPDVPVESPRDSDSIKIPALPPPTPSDYTNDPVYQEIKDLLGAKPQMKAGLIADDEANSSKSISSNSYYAAELTLKAARLLESEMKGDASQSPDRATQIAQLRSTAAEILNTQ